jgi:hypothetical protein
MKIIIHGYEPYKIGDTYLDEVGYQDKNDIIGWQKCSFKVLRKATLNELKQQIINFGWIDTGQYGNYIYEVQVLD